MDPDENNLETVIKKDDDLQKDDAQDDRSRHSQVDDSTCQFQSTPNETYTIVSTNKLVTKESQTDLDNKETVEELKNQLETIMNSLATLSAEKSKMEANFQLDRKLFRAEREECEKVIKDLKEKLKKNQANNHTEIEHIKCKLIMERHEREKERNEHTATLKELQKILSEERRAKEQLEVQAKSQFANKTQCKILEAELEITKNKLKQAEEASKETPPLLTSLQAEMTAMRKQHRNAILEEQKRAAAAEQRARGLAITHESRVAGLEARLAELSDIVGNYDRLRQQDQQAIQTLKEQLMKLQNNEQRDISFSSSDPEELVAKIKTMYNNLLDLDNKKNDSIHVKSLLNSLELYHADKIAEYKDKYENVLQELEDYKQYVLSTNKSASNMTKKVYFSNQSSDSHDTGFSKAQIHLLKTHNSNLEERIRILNMELTNKEKNMEVKLDEVRKLSHEERTKLEHAFLQKENELRGKVCTLEQQLLNQRERSMALIEEKNKEIITLKSSFQALLPKRENSTVPQPLEAKYNLAKYENSVEPSGDLVTGLLTADSPPILYYTQELARREVHMSTLRKQILELEAALREKQREVVHEKEKLKEETNALQKDITRLQACKSREGANLEYLKNVFVNFLTTNDLSSKRHMLNAISTILRFTQDESDRIKYFK
ncbi:GRIP and coiled-coil domain-containing protein 1-like [Prorops nasuta]|uniref:GRIP and coiled-coil domain-containing protein 1-like n=1 Tax=Prorops nasuta TaxID=863751 RepID=UPI0034CF8274